MRLIDADYLKEYIKDLAVEDLSSSYNRGIQRALYEVFPKIIDGMPTYNRDKE